MASLTMKNGPDAYIRLALIRAHRQASMQSKGALKAILKTRLWFWLFGSMAGSTIMLESSVSYTRRVRLSLADQDNRGGIYLSVSTGRLAQLT
jgi:hypothetical protein